MKPPQVPVSRIVVIGVIVSGALAAVIAQQAVPFGVTPLQMTGKYIGAERIAMQTQPLCRVLAPEAMPSQMTISLLDNRRLESKAHAYWSVDCPNADGAPCAHFLWDAVTGDLMDVSRSMDGQRTFIGTKMDRLQAIRTSRRWMRDLGIGDGSPCWRLAEAPSDSGNSWHVTLATKAQSVQMAIDARSGELVFLRRRPQPLSASGIRETIP